MLEKRKETQTQMKDEKTIHEQLKSICKASGDDYFPYGTRERKDDDKDCSCGCKYFIPLSGECGNDWGVCTSKVSLRSGRLTFKHQGCVYFEKKDI
jgi:hypothetical protein